MAQVTLSTVISQNIDATMQVELGKEIDLKIEKLQQIKLQKLSKSYNKKTLSEMRFRRIKSNVQIGSVFLGGFLAVAALIATVATIVFSKEILAGTVFLTAYSVTLTIAPAFNALYTAISGYFDYLKEKKQNHKNEIDQLKDRISAISSQIKDRIVCIKNIPRCQQTTRGQEILEEVVKLNAFIQKANDEFPEERPFQKFDSSSLLIAIA